MAWVPLVAPNRQKRGSSGRMITAVAFLLLFGFIFWLFFDPVDGFVFIPVWIIIIGFCVFFIIIGIAAAVASSMSSSTQNIKEEHMKHMNSIENQERILQVNPYRVQNSIQNQQETVLFKEMERDIPVISDINYCRYCGEKVDRDAIFCHQCGSRL